MVDWHQCTVHVLHKVLHTCMNNYTITVSEYLLNLTRKTYMVSWAFWRIDIKIKMWNSTKMKIFSLWTHHTLPKCFKAKVCICKKQNWFCVQKSGKLKGFYICIALQFDRIIRPYFQENWQALLNVAIWRETLAIFPGRWKTFVCVAIWQKIQSFLEQFDLSTTYSPIKRIYAYDFGLSTQLQKYRLIPTATELKRN